MISVNQASIEFLQSVQQAVSNNFGDYDVVEQLSHGAFGHVYKIQDRKSKRIYAMKVLFCNNPHVELKIKNEINIHQSLKSRYIIRMNNHFSDKDMGFNYYLILEYCEKGDLQAYILKNYPNFGMPLEEVRKIAQQIAKGISYLHKQDIVHGDIKVNNILINQKDEFKICDFGLSTKRKNKEKVNGAKGTLNYLSPQCMLPYDEKVDIWSFGVLIYLIATGTYPFHIENYKKIPEVLSEEKLKKFDFPQKIGPKLKDMLKNIFVCDPAKRYSITDVLNHPFITGQQIIFKEPPIIIEEEQPVQRMRSHAYSTIEVSKKSDSLKMTLDPRNQQERYHSKRSRPNSQNRDYDLKKAKDNYLCKIAQKKTKMMQKYSDFDKENNINYENVRTQVVRRTQTRFSERQTKKVAQKPFKIETVKLKDYLDLKQLIEPLNTEGVVIKPIVEKNCVTKIDGQGICRIRQEVDEDNKKILKEIKISPDGQNVYLKLNKTEKFYKLEALPEKYFKEYENCKKIVNSVKNHTPKMVFEKKTHTPSFKDIKLTVMFSGKVFAEINGHKIESTEKQLEEDNVTFAQSQEKFLTLEEAVKKEVKVLYNKLTSI